MLDDYFDLMLSAMLAMLFAYFAMPMPPCCFSPRRLMRITHAVAFAADNNTTPRRFRCH